MVTVTLQCKRLYKNYSQIVFCSWFSRTLSERGKVQSQSKQYSSRNEYITLFTPYKWRRVPTFFQCLARKRTKERYVHWEHIQAIRHADSQERRGTNAESQITSFAKIVTSSCVAYLILQRAKNFHFEFHRSIRTRWAGECEEGESFLVLLLPFWYRSRDCERGGYGNGKRPPSDEMQVGKRAEIQIENSFQHAV